jgi:hypothetical protein
MNTTAHTLRRCVPAVLAGWLLSVVTAFAQVGYCDRAVSACFSSSHARGHFGQASLMVDSCFPPLKTVPHHAMAATSAPLPVKACTGAACTYRYRCDAGAEPFEAAVSDGLHLTARLHETGHAQRPLPTGAAAAPRPHPFSSLALYLQKHTLII